MVRPRKISDFKPTLTNLAQTSHYQVIFSGLPTSLRQHLNVRGVGYRFITETSGLLCYSAVLPGSRLATADIVGNYMGVSEKMAHTRLFTQIQLEFYVDKEYKTLKFLDHWMEFIGNGSGQRQSDAGYYYRMEYPDSYKSNQTKIIKFDRDYKEEIEYTFYGMFPIDLSSTTVKYETSEVLKATATFSFDRYIAGKFDSYSLRRGTDNNKVPGFDLNNLSKAQVARSAETSPGDVEYELVPVPGQFGLPTGSGGAADALGGLGGIGVRNTAFDQP